MASFSFRREVASHAAYDVSQPVVVDPRRQLGHVVGHRVALDPGELAEVARGV